MPTKTPGSRPTRGRMSTDLPTRSRRRPRGPDVGSERPPPPPVPHTEQTPLPKVEWTTPTRPERNSDRVSYTGSGQDSPRVPPPFCLTHVPKRYCWDRKGRRAYGWKDSDSDRDWILRVASLDLGPDESPTPGLPVPGPVPWYTSDSSSGPVYPRVPSVTSLV